MAATPNRLIEILRRILLIAGIAASAWLAFLTDLRPSIAVSQAAAAETTGPPSADALLDQPRAEKPVRRLDVSGVDWQTFFNNTHASFASNRPVRGWERRIPARELEDAERENTRRAGWTDQDRQDEAESVQRVLEKYGVDTTFRGSFKRLYFDADEPPFPSLPVTLADYEPVDLVLAGANEPPIRIERAPAHEFVEFSDVNPLPVSLKYRRRHVAWWPLAAAFVVYALLPWFRPSRAELAYQRWRIVLSDVVSGLLWGGFFLLPLGVIGGSVEAVTRVPGFTAVPWALALLGLLSFYWVARHASYLLALRDGGFDLYTLSGHESLAWSDVHKVEGVQITPPRWFIILSFAAIFLGGSRAARLGQAGRALIVAGSRVNGLRLTARDGSVRHIWISDQMGGQAMKNVDQLMDAIARADIERPSAPIQLKALFPPA